VAACRLISALQKYQAFQRSSEHLPAGHPVRWALPVCRLKESQMPKLKTKSGAKKRFKVTASGKVKYAQRGKRHGMIKRTKKQIRQLRGTNVLFKTDGDNIKKYFLPNG
jgi:large subunit ribosomal protein L35